MPLRTDLCSKRSSPRGAGERSHRFLDTVDWVELARQLEQGQPDVLLLLEPHGDFLADLDVGGVTPDDVGREVDAGVFFQRDVGDDVGGIEARQPAMGVDREPHDRAATRDRSRLRRPAPAVRANGHRRMDQLAAVAAPLYAQDAIGARGPEPLAGQGQLRKRPHGLSLVWPWGLAKF